MILPVLCGAGWDVETRETLLGESGVSHYFLKVRELLIKRLMEWLEFRTIFPLQASGTTAGVVALVFQGCWSLYFPAVPRCTAPFFPPLFGEIDRSFSRSFPDTLHCFPR